MLYRKTESRVQPESTQQISGDRYLIRRNIKQESRKDTTGAAFDLWVYDEAVATVAEYAAYLAVQNAEQRREAEIVDDYTLQLIEEGVL